MADEYDSSDIEFEPPTNDKRANPPGSASIQLIIENAEADRIKSKRTIKQLQFGHGAPKTRESQSLWVTRFNAFRQHTLKQSLKTPFTGDDLVRFFDAIIPKIRPVDTNKPAPNDDLVTNAFKVLFSYGEFTWDEKEGFKLARRDVRRLQTFVDDAVKAGRLIKGLWRKKAWIGFVTLSRMVRAFLEHAHANGCWSWDVVIAKCVSVVLVASLGCRSGDVTRSLGYTGTEYLQWRHIDLYCEGKAEYINLRAIVTLEYRKGYKDTLNYETLQYLRPLDDPSCQHVCPIALILVHALRNGLVYGTSLGEVLDHASRSPGLRVQWKHPDLPVLCAIGRKPSRCDLAKPSVPMQLLETIKLMGLVSNVLTRVYTHALRLGAARDLAHLPQSTEGMGFTTDEVRQSLGHKASTLQMGVTENYVGGSSREDWNARAENKSKTHRREPKFSHASAYDLVKAPVTKAEVDAWRDSHKDYGQEREYSAKNETKRIQNSIRRERRDQHLKTAPPENPLTKGKTNSEADALKPTCPSKTNLPQRSLPVDDDFDYTLIEPSLLDGATMEGLEVPHADLSLLQRTVFPPKLAESTSTNENIADSAGTACNEEILSEECAYITMAADGVQASLTAAPEWIDQYAKINVVHNGQFATQWVAYSDKGQPFESTIGEHSVRGHSRDDPTPWIFTCRKTVNCTYRTLRKPLLEQHEGVCDEALVEAMATNEDRVPCTWEGCGRTFADKTTLRTHEKSVHEWLPKPCEHGCDTTKLYKTKGSYQDHLSAKHNGRWPSHCLYPGCTSQKTFNFDKTLKNHLAGAHEVTDATDQIQYLPPYPAKLKFSKQTCFVDDCSNETVMPSRSRMLRHLTSYHGMSEADGNDLIDTQAHFDSVTPTIRVHKVSTKRKTTRAFGFEDDIANEVKGGTKATKRGKIG